MSGLLGWDGLSGIYVLTRGKHAGRTLREVAQEHPGYLRWLYTEVDDLTKAQQEAIEEVAEEEGVEL